RRLQQEVVVVKLFHSGYLLSCRNSIKVFKERYSAFHRVKLVTFPEKSTENRQIIPHGLSVAQKKRTFVVP
ncbi:MAG: hypothetical protein K2K43_04785, partial [Alistipes sp.]|nr:hypothetical protein [Alistipes sp.]